MARREVSRFKDLMRRRGVYPDDDLDSDDGPDSRDGSPRGYGQFIIYFFFVQCKLYLSPLPGASDARLKFVFHV